MTRPTTTGKAQDLITFTRSTTGTALAKISYGEELVTNGDFASGSTGWALSNWTWSNGSLSITNLTGSITQAVTPLVTGKTYTVSLEVSELTQGNWYLWVNGTYVIGASTETGAIKYSWTQSSADKNVKVVCGVSSTLTVDNISIKEVLYDQPDGTLQLFNHPINKPRIEYDASGNCLGLLVEEARTNDVLYSNDLLNSYWEGSVLTVVSSIPSIAGGQCFKLSSGNPVLNYWIQTTVASNGQTKSIWARTVSGTGTAHILGHHSVAATLVTLTEQWQRFSLPVNTSEIGGDHIYAVDFRGSGTLSEILVFGAQVETGSFTTSYIPTSGSTVTRAADVASLAVSEFGYNQDQGTVVVSGHYAGLGNLGTSGVFELNQAVTAPNGVELRLAQASGQIQGYDNNGIFVSEAGNVPVNSDFKIALGFVVGGTNAAASYNGSTTNAFASVDVNTVSSIELFKHDVNLNRILNGHLKSVQYYPLRLSNAQLQALTV